MIKFCRRVGGGDKGWTRLETVGGSALLSYVGALEEVKRVRHGWRRLEGRGC